MKNIFTFLSFFLPLFSFGQGYILDTTFGNSGKLVHSSIDNFPINIYYENNNYFLVNSSNSIVCLNYDGSINTSFGSNGKLSFNGTNENFIVSGSKLSNGNFFIFGQIVNTNSSISKDLFIVKVSTSGVLDSGFGTNGIVRQDFGEDEILNDILILNDGKIMGIGSKYTSISALMITKHNSNGSIDTIFDSNGYKILPISQSNRSNGSNLFAFENSILVVGKSYYNESSGTYLHNDLVLIKIDENGNYITSFGTNGVKKKLLSNTLSDLGSYTVFNATLINGNDLYFGLYYAYSFTTQLKYLKKYDIATDTYTNLAGLPFSYPFYVVDNNQYIYITGTERCSPNTASNCSRNFNLYRKTMTGDIDTSFNGNGSYSYNFFPSDAVSDDRSSAFYLHSDGKIAMFGYGYNPYSTNGSGLEVLRLTEGVLSINEQETQHKISLFPNPANDELHIKSDVTVIDFIQVFDIYGKEVINMEGNIEKVNVKNLQKGLYFLQINSNEKVLSLKFIKQ